MTAIRTLIFRAIEQAMREIDSVAEVERMPSSDPATFPAVHIFDSSQDPTEFEAQSTRYDLAVTIEAYLEGEGGSETHDELNELHAAVVAALITEPPLDGLVETIDEGAMRTMVAPLADARRLGFSLDFAITFPTRRGDPTAAA